MIFGVVFSDKSLRENIIDPIWIYYIFLKSTPVDGPMF